MANLSLQVLSMAIVKERGLAIGPPPISHSRWIFTLDCGTFIYSIYFTDGNQLMQVPKSVITPFEAILAFNSYVEDTIDWQGVNLVKGRVSVSDIIGSQLISSKPDASPKCWDSSLDLVNILKHEIRDGQLEAKG